MTSYNPRLYNTYVLCDALVYSCRLEIPTLRIIAIVAFFIYFFFFRVVRNFCTTLWYTIYKTGTVLGTRIHALS